MEGRDQIYKALFHASVGADTLVIYSSDSQMFLVTTPNQKYWNNNEKIIFLGEWCKLYNQKGKWDKLDHQTFPHHWENRDDLYRDLSYTNSLYEKYLKQPVIHKRENTK